MSIFGGRNPQNHPFWTHFGTPNGVLAGPGSMESHGIAVGGPRGHCKGYSITGNSIGCHLASPADTGFGVSRGVHFGPQNWSIWESGPRNLVLRISRCHDLGPQIGSQIGSQNLMAEVCQQLRRRCPLGHMGPQWPLQHARTNSGSSECAEHECAPL